MESIRAEDISAVYLCRSFDPTSSHAAVKGRCVDSPLFKRSVQGLLYEAGFGLPRFHCSAAIDLGIVTADTVIDTSGR